ALQCWGQPPDVAPDFRIAVPASSGPGGGFARMSPPPMARTADGRTVFLARQSQILLWEASQPDRLKPLPLPGLPEPAAFARDRRGRPPPPPEFEREGRRPDPSDPEHKGGGGRHHWAPSWQMLAVAPDGTRLYLIDNRDRVHVLERQEGRSRWLDWPL